MIFQCLDFSNQKSDSATLFLDQIHFVILLCIKKKKITPKGRQVVAAGWGDGTDSIPCHTSHLAPG